MAKIFLELSTGIGPLIRCLPIAQWLRDEGHEVRYFARDNATKYMKLAGFQPVDIDPARVPYVKAALPKWRDVDEMWGAWGFNDYEWLKDRIGVWTDYLSKYSPDVVLTDYGILSSVAATLLDLPLATITQSCMHKAVFGGTQGFWMKDHPDSFISRDTVNKLFASSGCKRRIDRFVDLWHGDRTIIPSLPEFDLLEGKHASDALFVGPILWDGNFSGVDPQAWPTFSKKRPVVFAYTGRMRDGNGKSGELILRLILEAAQKTDFNFVISTGGMDEVPEEIDCSAPNVSLLSWVPIETAYSRSDLVIHHGGHGSCLAAVKYGIPSLVLPTHTEREYNARMLTRMGCANFLPRSEVNGPALASKLGELMADQAMRARVLTYRDLIARSYTKGPQLAGEAILSLISGGSTLVASAPTGRTAITPERSQL